MLTDTPVTRLPTAVPKTWNFVVVGGMARYGLWLPMWEGVVMPSALAKDSHTSGRGAGLGLGRNKARGPAQRSSARG